MIDDGINSPSPFDTLVLAILYYLLIHALEALVCIFFCEKRNHPVASSCRSIRISCAKATVPLILDRNKDAVGLVQNREHLDEDRTSVEAQESP